MDKKADQKNTQVKERKKKNLVPVEINRRREWRFDLPLRALVRGTLPQGKTFKEAAKLENISSGGAYFCLDSGIVVGSKLNLIINFPRGVTEGKKIKLRIGGITVRLEKADKKGKKQGVAVRFSKEFKFVVPDNKK
jgi:c-di-GMP-binding flagellar brake protein YcgR